jgi:hypothetical protein
LQVNTLWQYVWDVIDPGAPKEVGVPVAAREAFGAIKTPNWARNLAFAPAWVILGRPGFGLEVLKQMKCAVAVRQISGAADACRSRSATATIPGRLIDKLETVIGPFCDFVHSSKVFRFVLVHHSSVALRGDGSAVELPQRTLRAKQ